MGKGSGGAGVDRRGAEHAAQSIDHRMTSTVPSQGPDHTGESTECVCAGFIPGAVRHLARYHRPSQRPLCSVVRRLYTSTVQKPQQVPTIVLPAKLVLQPQVVAVRHRTVSEMMESGLSDYALTGRALRLLGHTGLAEEMLELLKHPHPLERQITVEALGGFGDERAVGPVIEAVRDDDCEVRASAVRALGHLGDTKAVQPLVDVLDDPEHWVAAEAVHSLKCLGDVRAVPHLTPLLEHDKGSIRVAARQALKRLRGSPGTVYDPFGHLDRAGAGNPTSQIGRPADEGDSL